AFSRHRLDRAHADRPRLPRRLQRHPGPGAGRPRHRPGGEPRRPRPGGGRGRRDGRRAPAGQPRLQHGAAVRAPRRPAGHGAGHEHRPSVLLRPHGHRHGRQAGDARRDAGGGGRRAGVDLARPERQNEPPPHARPLARRARAAALHGHAGNRRDRGGPLRRFARAAGRVRAPLPAAHRRRAAGRPLRRRDRAHALPHGGAGQGHRRDLPQGRHADQGRGQPARHLARGAGRPQAGAERGAAGEAGPVHHRRQRVPTLGRRLGLRGDGGRRSVAPRPPTARHLPRHGGGGLRPGGDGHRAGFRRAEIIAAARPQAGRHRSVGAERGLRLPGALLPRPARHPGL
ncbi:MAG: 3-ketoacyl-CoA thiolase @ Acetyl-CoA acetyltransferase, partial [uncultured Gemmatimonadaceae bacterium]